MKLRQDDNDKHTTLYATFERSARFVEDVRARWSTAVSLRDP